MNQTTAILNHLQKRGSLTPLQALNRYGCSRLAARIYDLKEAGHCIYRERVRVKTRAGESYVARYSM